MESYVYLAKIFTYIKIKHSASGDSQQVIDLFISANSGMCCLNLNECMETFEYLKLLMRHFLLVI